MTVRELATIVVDAWGPHGDWVAGLRAMKAMGCGLAAGAMPDETRE